MRKMMSVLFIIILSFILLITLSGCSKNEEKSENEISVIASDDKEVLHPLDGYEAASLNNKVYGVEVRVNYLNDGSVTLLDSTENIVKLSNTAENLNMSVSIEFMTQSTFDSNKENVTKTYSQEDGFKELTFGVYSGYGYVTTLGDIKMNLVICSTIDKIVVAEFICNPIDSSIVENKADLIDSNFVRDIAEHLQVSTTAEKYNVSGTLNGEATFYVKTIDESLYKDCTIEEHTQSKSVNIIATDSNGLKTNIIAQIVLSTSLDQAVTASRLNESKFVDTSVSGYNSKMIDNTVLSNTMDALCTYYIEKDGKIYQVNYQVEKGFSTLEVSQKLLEEVVANLTLFAVAE